MGGARTLIRGAQRSETDTNITKIITNVLMDG